MNIFKKIWFSKSTILRPIIQKNCGEKRKKAHLERGDLKIIVHFKAYWGLELSAIYEIGCTYD